MEAFLVPWQGWLSHLIPYAIIVLNCIFFKLLRSFFGRIFRQHNVGNNKRLQQQSTTSRVFKLFIDELISTSELCADCAELNVVYEKHGSWAYGLSLFILTYIWIDTFGEAHTTPGYLAEDYFLISGNELLKTSDTYARFVGQSLAMPLAWRLASFYWKYHLLSEHSSLLVIDNCKSSLVTSATNGFLIEFVCCFICRLAELVGHKMLERNQLSQRAVSLISSFLCSILVVMALELSGGYFNPVLAASLEYGCKGINTQQHALVFWLAPLVGHVSARALFKRYSKDGHRQSAWKWPAFGTSKQPAASTSKLTNNQQASTAARRQTRSSASAGQKGGRRKSEKID